VRGGGACRGGLDLRRGPGERERKQPHAAVGARVFFFGDAMYVSLHTPRRMVRSLFHR